MQSAAAGCGGRRAGSAAQERTVRGAGSSRRGYGDHRAHPLGHGLDDPPRARRWRAGGLHGRRRRAAPAQACQSPVWDSGLALLALPRAVCPTTTRSSLSRRVPPFAGGVRQGRLGGPRPRRRARRLGVRVRERFLPGRRRHRRHAARPPRHGHRRGGGDARGLDWLVGMQTRDGGWGAFDVDNDARWLYKIPFGDFGEVTTSRAPTSPRIVEMLASSASRRRGRARARVAPRRAGGRRIVVRPLGREPHLRHGCSAAGARGGAAMPNDHPSSARSRAGSTRSSSRTGASARTSAPTPTRLARPRGRDAVADRVGAARLVAAGNARLSRAAGGRLSLAASARTETGTRGTSPALVSPSISDPVPPLPHHVPAARTRTTERKAASESLPLASTVSIGRYVAAPRGGRTLSASADAPADPRVQHRLHRLREDPRVRVEPRAPSVEECVDAAFQCPAPVVWICGGEPLVSEGIDEVVPQVLELGKTMGPVHERCAAARAVPQLVELMTSMKIETLTTGCARSTTTSATTRGSGTSRSTR